MPIFFSLIWFTLARTARVYLSLAAIFRRLMHFFRQNCNRLHQDVAVVVAAAAAIKIQRPKISVLAVLPLIVFAVKNNERPWSSHSMESCNLNSPIGGTG